ncbi:hypothetical protein VTO73DRAFT_4186 [Trametes versicolor]
MSRCSAAPLCKFTSSHTRGLTRHEGLCVLRAAAIEDTLRKRVLEDEEDLERRTRKRARTGLEGFFADVPLPPPSPPPAPPSPPQRPRLRSGRRPRVPKHLVDYLPSSKDELPAHLALAFPDPEPEVAPLRYRSPTVEDADDDLPANNLPFFTPPTSFGIYREYTVAPQRDPEANISLSSVCDAPTLAKDTVDPDCTYTSIKWITRNSAVVLNETGAQATIGPFSNVSQFRLYDWFYNASLTKSKDDFDDLIDVLCSKNFSTSDLGDFSSRSAQETLDKYEHPSGLFSKDDGWHTSSVEIPLPKTKAKYPSEEAAPTFKVDGIHHRRITDIIRGAAEDKRFADQYHWIPNKTFWQPPSTSFGEDQSDNSQQSSTSADSSLPEPVRIFTDIYNSNRMLREHEKICAQPRNPADGPNVEYVIAAICLWSDMTHLTSFGSAALWPIYLYFGNLSKYIRGMPTEFAAHHLAYIPAVRFPS